MIENSAIALQNMDNCVQDFAFMTDTPLFLKTEQMRLEPLPLAGVHRWFRRQFNGSEASIE
jgi:hypothetical protein